MQRDHFDIIIIGAGINGAGIARDAAGRGLKVALVEAGDLGGGTSSASTKLIHGGLRYLEFYEFALVREALAERETILSIAPHLASPMPFVLPLSQETRPSWMIRAGLLLYDRLAKRRSFPNSQTLSLRDDIAGHGLADRFTRAFRYWDGWVDDSRLVIANCQDAARRGAEILPRDGAVTAFHSEAGWLVALESGRELYGSRIVNCTGPWAEDVAKTVLGLNDAPRVNLVQGAHIVVPRAGRQRDAYMLQQPDGRIIFVIPFKERYSLIGTTETRVSDAADPQITEGEIDYLLAAANRYLRRELAREDIVASFAGIRPLVLEEGKGARETSREWKFLQHSGMNATTVIGGKLTTYRLLAEALLAELYPKTAPWTADQTLPGGDIPRSQNRPPHEDFRAWTKGLCGRFPDHDPDLVGRFASLYGTRAEALLAGGVGRNLGGIFEAEVDYLVAEEWARTAEDILWRRTKLGLSAPPEAADNIERHIRASYTPS
ncbi:glycerol-3-phosphate dehydrogenase [Pacificimonas flava]|uniref:Aerobic glycerol-3-phosphate dehydrogenase n=1 Tax=Pacificimonas flava TaxID=1234595 RepID=M2SB25_9SPHN|nr:glycerol-3-phosphate dehydrogenase [Pacificimonas flava]EMD82590.1 Aerobic glycerol-3-phosphate dehydrogenase [Pacificimonas flava]MBB5281418.1 glycerol-3-phosphate dehydrogenase [Pacificimonas flava]